MSHYHHRIHDVEIAHTIGAALTDKRLNAYDGHDIVLDKHLNIRCDTHDVKLGWYLPHQGRSVWLPGRDRCPVEVEEDDEPINVEFIDPREEAGHEWANEQMQEARS